MAHLAEDGTPTATLFTNDLTMIPAGEGKLTVRHTAAAPAVDVLANGAAAFTNLTNPNEVKANLPVGTISAAVALTGTTAPVIGNAGRTPVAAGHDAGTGKHKPPQQTLRADRPLAILQPSLKISALKAADKT